MNEDLEAWLHGQDSDAPLQLRRLRDLLEHLDEYQAERWQRRVPMADAIVDRWNRAKRLGFGPGTSIYDSALVLGEVEVGAQTWIGPGTILDGSGGLRIGDHCSISAGVQIYSHDSVLWAVTGGQAEHARTPTRIGSNTYIGPNAIIARGTTVGERCIIGANSLVNRDVPDDTIVHGTPARQVARTQDYIAKQSDRSDA